MQREITFNVEQTLPNGSRVENYDLFGTPDGIVLSLQVKTPFGVRTEVARYVDELPVLSYSVQEALGDYDDELPTLFDTDGIETFLDAHRNAWRRRNLYGLPTDRRFVVDSIPDEQEPIIVEILQKQGFKDPYMFLKDDGSLYRYSQLRFTEEEQRKLEFLRQLREQGRLES